MGDWPLNDISVMETYGIVSGSYFYDRVSGPANTKGSWSELTSATAWNSCGIIIYISYAAYNHTFLFDIGIGASGSEYTIIPNLIRSSSTQYNSYNIAQYYFPIRIPAGSRIATRCQTDGSSITGGLGIALFSGGYTTLQAYDKVVEYGANTSTSRGISIDPGTTANTKGNWIEMTSSCDPLNGFLIGIGNQNQTSRSWNEWMFEVGIGAAGYEHTIMSNLMLSSNNWGATLMPHTTPYIPYRIPRGSRIAIRAQSSITTDTLRLFDAVFYGVV